MLPITPIAVSASPTSQVIIATRECRSTPRNVTTPTNTSAVIWPIHSGSESEPCCAAAAGPTPSPRSTVNAVHATAPAPISRLVVGVTLVLATSR